MEQNCEEFGLDLLGYGSGKRGIVHVIGPELGLTRPGLTVVWGGYFPSQHFDACLRSPFVDYVVRGHGFDDDGHRLDVTGKLVVMK